LTRRGHFVYFESSLGKSWQDALQGNYKLTPEELAKKYGMWIGLPMLGP
jgi:hypothetical protein